MSELSSETSARAARARIALEGLSVGDAFGDRYFGPGIEVMPRIQRRELAPAPWVWTDDTHMALSIVEMLLDRGTIDRAALIARFAERFDPHRKYGVGAFNLMNAIRDGVAWETAVRASFDGKGSFGNGAAMRAAPLGAYFADDLTRVVDEARRASGVVDDGASARRSGHDVRDRRRHCDLRAGCHVDPSGVARGARAVDVRRLTPRDAQPARRSSVRRRTSWSAT